MWSRSVPAQATGPSPSSTMSSAGRIALTSSTGEIRRAVGSGDVNLVADRLELNADKGPALVVAANVIDAVSTGGDISVSDVDGAYERTLGLLVENVITSKAAGGSTSVVMRRRTSPRG